MSVFRKWYLLLRISWVRLAASFIFVLAVIMFYPATWTAAERISSSRGYLAGLGARLADPILWKRTLIVGLALVVLQAVFILCVYSFLDLIGRNKRLDQKDQSH
jgi:hypothetical protein